MASTLRERLGIEHPVIDTDGHVVEIPAATRPYLRESLGPELFGRYVEREEAALYAGREPAPLAERIRARVPQRGWWTRHTRDAFERALPMFPRLYYESMDTLGIDFAVLYPTNALTVCGVEDAELRQGLCRGYNEYFAATYGPFDDRLTPAGVVPMHTPAEAIAELEHCASLGLQVVALPEGVLRPVEQILERPARWMYPRQAAWFDVFGLDSIHDYDQVWHRAEELGLAVTFHGGLSPRPGVCTSVVNFSYNHVGMFMQSMYPLCKAMFMGGVVTRFPRMRFAFLECGLGWAVPLLSDLAEHWEKRRPEAMGDFDPAQLDLEGFFDYARRFGDGLLPDGEADLRRALLESPIFSEPPEERDDWAALGAATRAELLERFATAFYFGCEADDRAVVLASGARNGLGVDLQGMLGSDIGHWDVARASEVVPEAYGLVGAGLLSAEEFRRLTFDNAVGFLTAAAPDFFAGTVVERWVDAAIGSPAAGAPARAGKASGGGPRPGVGSVGGSDG